MLTEEQATPMIYRAELHRAVWNTRRTAFLCLSDLLFGKTSVYRWLAQANQRTLCNTSCFPSSGLTAPKTQRYYPMLFENPLILSGFLDILYLNS